jgi:hypothetical protein
MFDPSGSVFYSVVIARVDYSIRMYNTSNVSNFMAPDCSSQN